MRKICDWVRICEVADAKSTSQTSSTRIPSRLIDLEADGKLRLVNTDDLEVTSVGATRGFVALSYVWGKDQSFVLLKENELEFKAQLLLKDLPQTIQDAVVVTRCIGIQYLWVDAMLVAPSPWVPCTRLTSRQMHHARFRRRQGQGATQDASDLSESSIHDCRSSLELS